MTQINKLLIANRGEIASRIIRTCRKMGIATVVVYSEPDAGLPFVKEADEAVALGGQQATESYLLQDKIIEAAKHTKADAIHPGFGFLSENAAFAERCAKEGLLFIGPNPNAIASMGLKSTAKSIMESCGVPVIKGYKGSNQEVDFLVEQAVSIGFPILIKAVAGGGGKGMRIAEDKASVATAIRAAQQEAQNAFGNAELMLERYFRNARHIEFQIFGDQHGHAIHIFERECSIQRRYQKVVEESPAPGISDALRQQMGAAAVAAARAIDYDNAGTVEFILDQDNSFYFLEVNTRLQVEHPVTEMITGLDLVEWQILVAEGQPLPLKQEDINTKGHAVECRLYAEDALNDFLPAVGHLHVWQTTDLDGLRYESGLESGQEISIYYDPMIAKVVSHAPTRAAAIRKMHYALSNLICLGVTTNQSFLMYLMRHPSFVEAPYDTGFIAQHYKAADLKAQMDAKIDEIALACFVYRWFHRQEQRTLVPSLIAGWRNQQGQRLKERFLWGETDIKLDYYYHENGFDVLIHDKPYHLELHSCTVNRVVLTINHHRQSFYIAESDGQFFVHHPAVGPVQLSLQPRFPVLVKKLKKGDYIAPMPGEVLSILVQQGQQVQEGQPLITLLSMKMENTIVANENGVVDEIFVKDADTVAKETVLLKIKPLS